MVQCSLGSFNGPSRKGGWPLTEAPKRGGGTIELTEKLNKKVVSLKDGYNNRMKLMQKSLGSKWPSLTLLIINHLS